MSWKDHSKIFLKFYENDFDDLSFKSIDAEISLWKHHWENFSANLPDNVSATLKHISFPCFPFIKRALRILGAIPVSSIIFIYEVAKNIQSLNHNQESA